MKKIDWFDVDKFITDLMQEQKIPGLSLAVVKDGETIYLKGYGARNLKYNIPSTPDTLYGIASCTKSITCLAIMQLQEKGKLSVNDPIKKYLPVTLELDEEPITIHHLMSHSSGIPNLGMATLVFWRQIHDKEWFVPISSKTDFYNHINQAQSELVDKPGKKYFYFNSGFTMLGEIIEKVSGETFAKYVVDHILKPLEMTRSTFVRSIFNDDADRMTGYKFEEDKPVRSSLPFNWMVYAAGGLFTSVNEWSNYIKMIINKGRFGETRIIKEESLEKIFTVAIQKPSGYYGKLGYGYGWNIEEDFLGHKLFHHSGGLSVGSSYIGILPEKNIGVVTAANCGGGQGSLITQFILAKLLGSDPYESLPLLQIKEKFKKLTGKYTSYKEIHSPEIILKEGLLYLEHKEFEQLVPLIPKTHTVDTYEFYVYSMGFLTPVLFEVKNDDKIDLYIERNCYHKK